MLRTLHIRDLALIEHAEARFDRGLNVISGETGGGKSLVIAALKLLRGEKATPTLVRHGVDELRVDGEFVLHEGERSAAVAALLVDVCDLDPAGELLVTRIVDRAGRSKIRVNGRPTTLQVLKDLGAFLLEIHGQGDARALMRAEIQCETLDAFGGTTDLRLHFGALLRASRLTRSKLADVGSGERDRLQRQEFLRYQVTEFKELALQEGEAAQIEKIANIVVDAGRTVQEIGARSW